MRGSAEAAPVPAEQQSPELIEFTSAGYLRFVLMLFVCFWAFGCPEPTGIVTALSGFATPCFFILSGYFVLVDHPAERLGKVVRKIKRSAICMGIVLVFYILLNVGFCLLTNMGVAVTKRVVFNFVVLNLWPMPVGDSFWFIQSMVYAYIVILIAEKLKLMRFYKIVLILLIVVMLLTGEFAGLIKFNFLGYPYIPGNWLTRALPYILLGRLIREKRSVILAMRKWTYIVMFLIGAGLVILEMILLGRNGLLIYEGHMIGYGIMAFAICSFCLSIQIASGNRVVHFDPSISGLIYIFMNPIYYALVLFLGYQHLDFLAYFGGLTALLASVVLALILAGTPFSRICFSNWDQRLAGAMTEEEMDVME
ncbi:MAG: acyltransferase [Clostridiales bacterium]|nr:acyltransferase [Clostridiales bacterium]